jgi:DNA polymerase-3 subunit delta
MAINASEVRRQIQSRQTAPLYLLEGEDVQSRHELAHEFASLIDDELRAFNLQTFYANEATTAAARDQMIVELLASARTLPMMVPRRVLVVHEAEQLLCPRRAREEEEESAPAPPAKRGSLRVSPAEELEQYFGAPEPSTTMVFAAASLDENRRLVKALCRHAVRVDCGIVDESFNAERWIEERLKRERVDIEPQAVKALVQATGPSLSRIRPALDALLLFAAGEARITEQHVRDVVPQHDELGKGFALGRAIWNGNVREALKEIGAQLDAGFLPVMVLGQIRAAARGLKPDERALRGLDAVFRADLALKSSAGDVRHHLEKLVIELCTR